tara:strand:- start:1430 stop:2704 length:1275 start_codon:yes stop_codon:yes gene_type:complete
MGASKISNVKPPSIAVIGLGYVGLPLAVALSSNYEVIGFDESLDRIREIKAGFDNTGELSRTQLSVARLSFTCDPSDMANSELFIIAVPTPVDQDAKPDLSCLISASKTVGSVMRRGSIVVFESTVYPGVTEDVCGNILSSVSGLVSGKDFFLGYSPERINPGDQIHTIDQITKIVSGQNDAVTNTLKAIYGSVNENNIFVAADIRTAEAAKVIENAQRDINIAFVNEIALIFDRLGISTQDVLEAAGTKWNFLDFRPGLVGGHCIGVDPYYLAHAAENAGITPEILLAGRRINDRMSSALAERIAGFCSVRTRILVLGITFKENVPDIRNSKVVDLVKELEKLDFKVDVYDPLANASETKEVYGISLLDGLTGTYGAIVGAVPHSEFQDIDPVGLLRSDGLLADFKGIWRGIRLPDKVRYWSL